MQNSPKELTIWLGVTSKPEDTAETDPGDLAARQLMENASGTYRYSTEGQKTLYCVIGSYEEAEQIFRKERAIPEGQNVSLVTTTVPKMNLLDLTNEATIKGLKIFRSQLIGNDFEKTQMISLIARRNRFNGIIAPVADTAAKLLVLFY